MMEKYTLQERAEIVTMFIENNRSIIATQRQLRQEYPDRPVPHKTTIYRLHAKFQQYGTTADRPRSGRQRTSRNAENVALVRESVAESPDISIRKRGSQLHISARSLRRILDTDLKMCPFKIKLNQSLQQRETDQQETRRRQQSEAAERRANQEASRGVKDLDKIKRMQQRSEEMEKREQELSKQGGASLKWTAN